MYARTILLVASLAFLTFAAPVPASKVVRIPEAAIKSDGTASIAALVDVLERGSIIEVVPLRARADAAADETEGVDEKIDDDGDDSEIQMKTETDLVEKRGRAQGGHKDGKRGWADGGHSPDKRSRAQPGHSGGKRSRIQGDHGSGKRSRAQGEPILDRRSRAQGGHGGG